jgi:hypothetical protein
MPSFAANLELLFREQTTSLPDARKRRSPGLANVAPEGGVVFWLSSEVKVVQHDAKTLRDLAPQCAPGGGSEPRHPTKKSKSAPRSDCITCSTYSFA